MNLRIILLLMLGSGFAFGAAAWCMSSGVGVSPDSVIYLSAADSMRAGKGVKSIAYHVSPKASSDRPLIIFPPTYPLLLSLSGLLNADRLNSAKWLHAFLFAANVLLVAVIVFLAADRSALATLCGILLFLSSPSMLEIHSMAWSETPFILFVLIAVLLLMLHLNTPHYLLLVGSAFSASLALTTRYVGITILPPMLLTILILANKPLRGRIRDCLIFVGIAIFPLLAWLLRNVITADSATDRSIAFHPVGISGINSLIDSLLVFWVPFSANVYLRIILLFLLGALVLAGIVQGLKNSETREKSSSMNSAAQMFAAVFVIVFPLFLLAYNSLIVPGADVYGRVLSPVYVFGIILLISGIYKLSRFGKRRSIWWGFLILSFGLISVNAVRAVSVAIDRHDNGREFTSRAWAGSESVQYLRSLAESRTTYSNGIDAVYFLTRREALRIPAKIDRMTGKNNAEFDREIGAMRNDVLQNRAIVVYLDKITWRWYLPSKDELENVYHFPILVRLEDGVIYGSK